VEGLKPENVTVVDMAGGLLSKGHQEEDAGVLSRAQFEYQQKVERVFENRIMTMLEPVVGLNKVVAKVSAEVDFGRVNILEERFDPDNAVIRSEQREKETSTGGRTVPNGSPDLKYDIYGSEAGNTGLRNTFQKENATINYEINKLNKQTTNAVGSVKRLSTAVIIDGPYGSETGPKGEEVKKFLPRSRREMKTFEDIIKKAIGFSEGRGDQVNVSNFPFALQEEERAFSEQGASWLDYARKVTKPLFNVALVFLFFLLAVRPFKKWLEQAGQHMTTRALPQGEEVQKLASPVGHGEMIQDSKEQISRITKNNPDAVAEVIRSWISEGR
jgi:flagellar M-ring protein FliF